MLIRATPQRPVIFARRLVDRQVVDAGNAASHVALIVELPVLVPVRTEPLPGVVMPLIGKSDGNPVSMERPQLLDETVIQLLIAFTGQELHDGVTSGKKLRAVTPDTVRRIRQRHSLRVARVPGVFGHVDFLGCGLRVEWRQWWS